MSAPAIARKAFEIEETESIQDGDELRCSSSYKPDPKYTCSACGRMLCIECVRRPHFFRISMAAVALPHDLKPALWPVFCSDHQRWSVSPAAIAICACLAFAVLGMSANSGVLVLVSLAIGLGLLFTKSRLDRIWVQRYRQKSTAFGLLARYEFEIKENLALDFNLGNNLPYTVTSEPRGSMSVGVTFDQGDKDRFSKTGGKPAITDLHAGFFKSRGTRARFLTELSAPGLATPIRGPMLEQFLSVVPGRSIGTRFTYSIAPPDEAVESPRRTLPIRVFPIRKSPSSTLSSGVLRFV
jgi:hypothetical protein